MWSREERLVGGYIPVYGGGGGGSISVLIMLIRFMSV